MKFKSEIGLCFMLRHGPPVAITAQLIAGTPYAPRLLRPKSDPRKFNEEMVKAGVQLAGEGLHPTSAGARVRFPRGKAQVSDGPFSEAKEIVGGFWIIQVKSKEEAVAWASRCPNSGEEMIEIRRVYESEDFAASDPTGELREAEERLRKLAAANA